MTTKQFEFSYSTNEDPEEVTFADIEYPHHKRIDHRVYFTDNTRWPDVLREFAKFLDATGYVGVYDRIEKFIDENDAPLRKYLEEDDEDTSNPGLSD
jgi:hypothetical protein